MQKNLCVCRIFLFDILLELKIVSKNLSTGARFVGHDNCFFSLQQTRLPVRRLCFFCLSPVVNSELLRFISMHKQAKRNKTNKCKLCRKFVWMARFFLFANRSSLFVDFYKCLHRHHLFAFRLSFGWVWFGFIRSLENMCVCFPGHSDNKNSTTRTYLSKMMKIWCGAINLLLFFWNWNGDARFCYSCKLFVGVLSFYSQCHKPYALHYFKFVLAENGTSSQNYHINGIHHFVNTCVRANNILSFYTYHFLSVCVQFLFGLLFYATHERTKICLISSSLVHVKLTHI